MGTGRTVLHTRIHRTDEFTTGSSDVEVAAAEWEGTALTVQVLQTEMFANYDWRKSESQSALPYSTLLPPISIPPFSGKT